MRFQIETTGKAILICCQDHRIRNLSLGGMLIESKNALETGKILYLQISRSSIKSIRVSGMVASCISIKESGYAHYNIGIKFFGMLEKDVEMLREVICLLENMGFIAL
jgi:hypothetical protein